MLTDIIGVTALVSILTLPLGLYADDTGFGWFWPDLGGYHFSTMGD